ncbi:MAG: hypothetical protein KC609_05830 [Myxococcales bacterium]|nr:hypothetical protein [Myxococcales bacterium]
MSHLHRALIAVAISMALLALLEWQTVSPSDTLARVVGVMASHGRGGPRGPVRYGTAVVQRGYQTGDAGLVVFPLLLVLALAHLAPLRLSIRPWQQALVALGSLALLSGIVAGLFELHLFDRVVVLWPQYAFWVGFALFALAEVALLGVSAVGAIRHRPAPDEQERARGA